jgi:hypothetical protein
MNKDKYVFALLIEFLDNNKFRHLVDKYDGNRYVKHFTCWNQLLAMMFGQLSNQESLRDLIVAFEAHRAKQYHLGLGRKPIAKTTFASAYQNRDYRIFEDFAFYMMEQARMKWVTDIFKLKGNVYAFDSTTIPLCLSVFWWAKFRKKKGGVKAHVLYDLKSQVSAFFQSLQHPFTTQKQGRKFLMNQVLTMCLTVDTMHSRNFSKYICMNRSLLCEPRKICNTNVVNESAGCQKIY